MLIYGHPPGRQARTRQRQRRRQKRLREFRTLFAALGLVLTTALMYLGTLGLLFLLAKCS
ncbi:MAG: hypothetical protein SH809_08470 [Rhodothermales bacterium]|nr:hypothetical protein [Rhodothermales bacterium]